MKAYVVKIRIMFDDCRYLSEDIVGIYSTIVKAKNIAEKECERIRNEEEVFHYERFDIQDPPQTLYRFECDGYHDWFKYVSVHVIEMEVE